MQSTSLISPTNLTRQELLAIFMRREGLTYRSLAARIGVSGSSAVALLNGETIPPHRHEQLREFVPVELLPPPVYIKPGPSPKKADPAPDGRAAAAA